MNYQSIYNQIIERAKTRVLTCYKEKHHIVPLCLNPKSTETVYLTGREHFLVHWLLVRIYPENPKLKQAFGLMGFGLSHYKYKLSSVAYQEAKEKYSEALSNDEKRKEKLRRPLSVKHINKLKEAKLKSNYIVSKETKQKMSKFHKGKSKNKIPIIQLDPITLEEIKEWSSIGEVDKNFHCDSGACARGEQKTAGGFKWKYKN